jgi:hypothetical protein
MPRAKTIKPIEIPELCQITLKEFVQKGRHFVLPDLLRTVNYAAQYQLAALNVR